MKKNFNSRHKVMRFFMQRLTWENVAFGCKKIRGKNWQKVTVGAGSWILISRVIPEISERN
jgi:hypothetical protein